ncbi:MAG: hypothetical protein HYS81_04935 [Candidatus Aenigmatarchaeota archaeon]|nr:MAG: hypothetical protein HYS81_04935 [Candidatus Aenigmarchaeota archaeon]
MDGKILAAAFAVSAVLFLSGLGLGLLVSEEKADYLGAQVEQVDSDIESLQLEFLLLDTIGENATCRLVKDRLREVNSQSYELGNKVGAYEDNEEGINGESLDLLKRAYYHSLIKYWIFNKKVEDVCGEKTANIIYFFVRDCSACQDQGVVLSYYKEVLGENLLVFPISADFEDPFVQTLNGYYNVTSYPALVINGEKHEGFLSKKELGDRLCQTGQSLPIC